MSVDADRERICYRSTRRSQRPATFKAEYWPTDSPFTPSAGSLEYFLTERYCLYHVSRRGEPYRLEIHHPAWSLQAAQADIETNTMAASGIRLSGPPALLHFAKRQDAIAWAPTYLRSR